MDATTAPQAEAELAVNSQREQPSPALEDDMFSPPFVDDDANTPGEVVKMTARELFAPDSTEVLAEADVREAADSKGIVGNEELPEPSTVPHASTVPDTVLEPDAPDVQ